MESDYLAVVGAVDLGSNPVRIPFFVRGSDRKRDSLDRGHWGQSVPLLRDRNKIAAMTSPAKELVENSLISELRYEAMPQSQTNLLAAPFAEPFLEPLERQKKIEEFRAFERHLATKWKPLLDEIKRIPHLPIDLDINLDKIREEIKFVQEWHPHRLHANKRLPREYLDEHERNFRGQCLIDYRPDNVHGMSDPPGYILDEPDALFDPTGRVRFFVTPAGEQMPYTISVLKKMSPYVNRTRIICTRPSGGIPWHSHHNGLYRSSLMRLCIFNLPVQTSRSVVHSVRDFRDPNGTSHSANYEPGRLTLFNSWHDHDFWNNGQEDRIAIIPYFTFSDEDLLSFLDKQVGQYQGPVIPH